MHESHIHVNKRPYIIPDTMSLSAGNVGNHSKCIGAKDNFLNITVTVHTLRSTINKWALIKMKSFCIVRIFSIKQNCGL